jgi:EAL domain-containing protein (putative c-di-GMP-specific phosphodiesterase class I)
MAMATFARQTGAYVIAEGIEDDDTLLFLQQIESAQLIGQPSKLIQGGQGFSLAQPGPLTTDDTANLSLLGR